MKKNVASQVISAVVVSATDGSAITASVSVTVTGDAGTQGAGGGTLAHEGGGEWSYIPTQAETNFDHIMFKFSGGGSIPVGVQVYTQFPQTGDNFARLGAPAGASVSADIAAVKTQTAAIEVDTAEIGTAGAGLTNINLPNQTMDIVGNIIGNVSGSVGSVTAGVTLAASAVQAIWDALTSALTTAGSIGKLLVDNINATISSRLASASYTAPPDVNAIADQVWDEAIAGHAGAGSTGAALSAAGSAGDPWATALPGAYGAGTAGKIVGDNINATISSRLATAGYTAPLDAAGTRAAVGLASASLDTQLDAVPTAIENADALLDRNMATGTDSGSPTVRTPRQALRFLRNRWDVAAGSLTVKKEDDTTTSWTGTVSSDASALPIIGNDPAS